MTGFEMLVADPDYYLPLDRTIEQDDPGTHFTATVPESWRRSGHGAWTTWLPPDVSVLAQGWKVHVAARFERAAAVLDIVAGTCVEHGVPFKHLATERIFLWMHHKHGPRSQAGKFCAAFPADVDAARRLMDALHAALPGEVGAFPLTDRRYPDSGVVSYRYGAFVPHSELLLDGTTRHLIADGSGNLVPDVRGAQFVLPDGIEDPFATPEPAGDAGPVQFHGLTFTRVLAHSNGGGAYEATDATGRRVFVKEARGHNGYHWDRSTAADRLRQEYHVLRRLHAVLPGVAPEPFEHFAHWEHEFLVTEFVPGTGLWDWVVDNNPLIGGNPEPDALAGYFARCARIVGLLRALLDRLHAAGFGYGDLNPANVLVDDEDRPRLVDFEIAGELGQERTVIGAPGYLPVDEHGRITATDVRAVDDFALSAIAQLLVMPLHAVLDRHPAAAAHLLADVTDVAGAGEVPAGLWQFAVRHRRRSTGPALPGPAEVEADPVRYLAVLRDAVVIGLHGMRRERCGAGDPLYPLPPAGWATNPHGMAHGAAGILHALHVAGAPVPPDVVARFRAEVLRDRCDLPPGLLTGSAGVAWVLAELGHLDEASVLLETADRHPLTPTSATLAEGVTGVALTHLELYRHTGLDRHLRRAHELLAALPVGPELSALIGAHDASGWANGRVGIAQGLHYVGAVCDDPALGCRGVELLHHEIGRGRAAPRGGIQWPVSDRHRRAEPYLATGSAGFALVADRYLEIVPEDDALRHARDEALFSSTGLLSMAPGFLLGTAGMAFAVADAAHRGTTTLAAAHRSGRALFKYAVPDGAGGVRFPAAVQSRFRADLAGGSAGVLVALARLLDDMPDAAFTADRLLGDSRSGSVLAGSTHRRPG